MSLKEFIQKNRDTIADKWFKAIVTTYASDTSRFLINEKDQFANPVGNSIKESITALLGIMANGIGDENAIKAAVDPIIRIRAVQDHTASKAVSVVLFIKPIIRDLIAKSKKNELTESEVGTLDNLMENILLAAFDVFMACREQIYSFKASHVRDRTKKLLEKAGLLAEVPEAGTQILSNEAYKQNFGNN